MSYGAALPPDMWAEVQRRIDLAVGEALRSGPLRNGTITGGTGLTVGRGSKFTVQHPDGSTLLMLGAYDVNESFNLADGTHQPMALLRRADGSLALVMYDPDPITGGFQQFLAMVDRNSNIIVSDDGDSGQGLARPYVPGAFFRARFADWGVASTAASFETLWRAEVFKQHPKLSVATLASTDTSGTSGEVRVLVDGVQLGSTATIGFAQTTSLFGAAAVAGAHMVKMQIEIQGRRTAGTGALRVEPLHLVGRQT